mgnify:CR=1 FL=1
MGKRVVGDGGRPGRGRRPVGRGDQDVRRVRGELLRDRSAHFVDESAQGPEWGGTFGLRGQGQGTRRQEPILANTISPASKRRALEHLRVVEERAWPRPGASSVSPCTVTLPFPPFQRAETGPDGQAVPSYTRPSAPSAQRPSPALEARARRRTVERDSPAVRLHGQADGRLREALAVVSDNVHLVRALEDRHCGRGRGLEAEGA